VSNSWCGITRSRFDVEGKNNSESKACATRQSTAEEELSPGVYSISILKNVLYDFHGQGYCSATNMDSMTESIQVDGSDDSTTEFTLMFRGSGCPRNPTSEHQ
jgi:hypothetical protein